jgi:hypothetical protein
MAERALGAGLSIVRAGRGPAIWRPRCYYAPVAEPRPTECWIAVSSQRWVGEPGQLAGVLDALEADPRLVPERFGPDEQHLKPYTRKAVLSRAPKTRGREWFLMLVRAHPLALDGSIASTSGTKIQLGFTSEDSADGWRPVFELADEIARRTGPQLVAVTPRYQRRDPKEGEDAETIDWIIESGDMYEPRLRQYGLLGLAPRTYLGSDVVELIGRERIEGLALPRQWFEGGGVRIDLVPEPWDAKAEDLARPWREAMAILRESEVFSTGQVTSPHGRVIPKRGKRWP